MTNVCLVFLAVKRTARTPICRRWMERKRGCLSTVLMCWTTAPFVPHSAYATVSSMSPPRSPTILSVLPPTSSRSSGCLCVHPHSNSSHILCMQELVLAAVEGTRNVINAAADMGVQRVVFTSSYGAVHMNPNRSTDQTVDESCWSDPEFCKQTQVHFDSVAT